MEGLNIIRYGSRRVVIFFKNLLWFLWQSVKLSFLLVCYYYVKQVELHRERDINKKEWLEKVLLSFNVILGSAILLVLILAVNEAIFRGLRARRLYLEIVPCIMLISTPFLFFYIAYTMWWYLAEAIELNQDISADEIYVKPESEFLDLGYKMGIVMTLIVYLVANILLALFCIVSGTVAVNAMINIRHGN